MRLDGQEESENVEDRRGMGATGGAALGGGGLIIVLILSLLFHKDPAKVAQVITAGNGQTTQQPGGAARPDPREDQAAHFTKVILGDTEAVWTDQFRAMGRTYPKPTLVLFSGEVNSACGMAESATGPFYCPGDQRVYIDLSFYSDMQRQLHAPGDFARAYVVAHEVGHHVQQLLGYSRQVDEVERSGDKVAANHASVRLELQADYFAGVWAHYGEQKFHFLEQGDLESALNAAHQIGDDRLQQQARGRVVPDSFTHGTSAQRARWFKRGFDTGDIKAASLLFSLPYEQL